MDRRAFIVGAGASLVTGGFLHASSAAAQQAGNTYRIGVLAAGATEPHNLAFFIEGLRALGYIQVRTSSWSGVMPAVILKGFQILPRSWLQCRWT